MCSAADAKLARKAARAEKRAAKAAKRAAKAAAAPAPADGPAADSAPDRPSKKHKKGGRDAAAPPTPGAPQPARQRGPRATPAVGDAAAAAAGPPLVRDLYNLHPAVAAMTDADVDAWWSERRIAVELGTGEAASSVEARPCTAFDHAAFGAPLASALASFVAPSPIQAQCWPLLLSGRDLVGIAATGSGKTLAFGLPAFAHVRAQPRGRGPAALVLAPTRELAAQIADVLAPVGVAAGATVALAHGGVPKGPQVSALRAGAQICVGNARPPPRPGRHPRPPPLPRLLPRPRRSRPHAGHGV